MKKQKIPKMKDGIQKSSYPGQIPVYARHFQNLGYLGKTWGNCDKASSVGNFGGGGGS